MKRNIYYYNQIYTYMMYISIYVKYVHIILWIMYNVFGYDWIVPDDFESINISNSII